MGFNLPKAVGAFVLILVMLLIGIKHSEYRTKN